MFQLKKRGWINWVLLVVFLLQLCNAFYWYHHVSFRYIGWFIGVPGSWPLAAPIQLGRSKTSKIEQSLTITIEILPGFCFSTFLGGSHYRQTVRHFGAAESRSDAVGAGGKGSSTRAGSAVAGTAPDDPSGGWAKWKSPWQLMLGWDIVCRWDLMGRPGAYNYIQSYNITI